MSTVEEKRKRGRPEGYKMPEDQKRKRKDYRLSPSTIAQIEQGCKRSGMKETAFIEEAIAYSGAREYHLREVEHLQTRVTELEHDLQLAREEITALKSSKPAVVVAPQPKRSTSTSYQILIKHEPGDHSVLPDGFRDTYTPGISAYRCPVHEVFSERCSLNEARRKLDRLKAVTGIKEVWLTKNGSAMDREKWIRKQDRWERN